MKFGGSFRNGVPLTPMLFPLYPNVTPSATPQPEMLAMRMPHIQEVTRSHGIINTPTL